MAGPERSSFAAKMSLVTDRSARRRSGDRHRGSAASVAHTEPADERAIVVEVLAGSEAEGRVPPRASSPAEGLPATWISAPLAASRSRRRRAPGRSPARGAPGASRSGSRR